MEENIDFDFIKNAAHPKGEQGVEILSNMNTNHGDLTLWGFSHIGFGKEILDIGCGGGGAIQRLSKLYPESKFYGCDISETSIECSKNSNEELLNKKQLELKKCSVSKLEYSDESFDSIYSIESIYFWPNQQEDLKEVFRVLKKGGKFMTALEMVGGSLSAKGEKIAEHLEMECPTPERLKGLLENAGFSNVKVDFNRENSWLCGVGEK